MRKNDILKKLNDLDEIKSVYENLCESYNIDFNIFPNFLLGMSIPEVYILGEYCTSTYAQIMSEYKINLMVESGQLSKPLGKKLIKELYNLKKNTILLDNYERDGITVKQFASIVGVSVSAVLDACKKLFGSHIIEESNKLDSRELKSLALLDEKFDIEEVLENKKQGSIEILTQNNIPLTLDLNDIFIQSCKNKKLATGRIKTSKKHREYTNQDPNEIAIRAVLSMRYVFWTRRLKDFSSATKTSYFSNYSILLFLNVCAIHKLHKENPEEFPKELKDELLLTIDKLTGTIENDVLRKKFINFLRKYGFPIDFDLEDYIKNYGLTEEVKNKELKK
jgi:hypothetical protein